MRQTNGIKPNEKKMHEIQRGKLKRNHQRPLQEAHIFGHLGPPTAQPAEPAGQALEVYDTDLTLHEGSVPRATHDSL